MTRSVDLNADMGESFGPWNMGDDAALLKIISSANIACGFHAGDWDVMASTIKARQAGFNPCIDTQAMYLELLGSLQEKKVLPV